MISKQEILDHAQEWQLRPEVVEKDYVIGWLLWGIANTKPLSDQWIFKGGTCLKKCFIETYRFSEDLDFTVLPGGPIFAEDAVTSIRQTLTAVTDASGITFAIQPPKFRDRPNSGSTEGRVYYQGPLQVPSGPSVKIDLTVNETVIQPPVLRLITHPYTDSFPAATASQVRCYGFEEVFAEKIRALGERCRPRDLYDVVNLYRRQDLRAAPSLIANVLTQKCDSKHLQVPTYTSITTSPHYGELMSEWANMLGHQLAALPPIDPFVAELESVFQWIAGVTSAARLQPIGTTGESIDTSWTPPPTVWSWGNGVPLEPVRFAGANRLCVELTYNSSTRLIEPYSVRRTQAGNILLYAVKCATNEIRSYRVDRIQGVRVTTRPFTPRYLIEFSATAAVSLPSTLSALTIPRRTGTVHLRRSIRRASRSFGQPTYIISCPYCQKEFRRSSRDFTLREHKDTFGYSRCPGSGRRGNLIDTRY